MTDLTTHEHLADTEARHAHRDLLAEKDAEIERLTALLQSSSEMLHEAAVEFEAIHPGAGIAEAIRYQIAASRSPAMTSEKAPERIWADPDHWVSADPSKPGYVEYVRADVADAMVAAAYEAAAKACDGVIHKYVYFDPAAKDRDNAFPQAVRALTPSDARAALADAERKAWNECATRAEQEARIMAGHADDKGETATVERLIELADAIAALKKEPEA